MTKGPKMCEFLITDLKLKSSPDNNTWNLHIFIQYSQAIITFALK